MADFKPGDNKDNKEQNDAPVAAEESQQPDQKNDLEPAQPAVMAGLSSDEIGINADTTSARQSPSNPENQRTGQDAQDLAENKRSEESIFTANPDSNKAAMDQIGLGMQGIEGQVSGVMGTNIQSAQIQEEKNKKEREKTVLALAAIQNMAELTQAFEEQEAKLAAIAQEAEEAHTAIQRLDEQLNPKIEELEELLAQQKQELQDLKDRGASQDEIDLKQLEVNSSTNLLKLYQDTHQNLSDEYQAAAQKLNEAQQEMAQLKEQMDRYEDGDIPQDLIDKMSSAEQKVQDASSGLTQVNNKIEFTQKMIDLSSEAHKSIASSEYTCQSDAAIIAQSQFVDSVIKFSEDGKFTAEEALQLKGLAEDSGYTQEQVLDFADNVSNSGIDVLDAEGNALSPDQIKNYILNEWKEVQEAKAEVESEIDTTTADLAALEQQINQAKQELNQEQAELEIAQNALKAEQEQSVQATSDAASITSVMSQYEDINDYMEQNYSMTFGVGPLSKTFGAGEDIDTVAQDESRILKDNDGNFVYMDNEDQTLYTLAKNEDGSIKLDENGQQEKVVLTADSALALQSKMYSDKLVPRNFVSDDAFPEHSGDDTYVGTLVSSMTGMEKGVQQENVDLALQQQKEQELAAQARQQQEANDLTSAQGAVDAKAQDVATAEANLADLEKQKQAILTKEQDLKQEALAQNVTLDESAIDNKPEPPETMVYNDPDIGIDYNIYENENGQIYLQSEDGTNYLLDDIDDENKAKIMASIEEQKQNGNEIAQNATNQESTEESETTWTSEESVTLEADPEYMDLSSKVANRIEGGSISKEELDEIMSDAPPELREKLEASLENQGITVNDPEQQLANNASSPTPTTEPSGTLSVSYPAIGANAQVQVINAPSVKPPTNGVSPATAYTSFADSPEFAATNDPKNPDATYAAPTNNHTSNVVDASDKFGKALTDQPAAGTGAPTPEQLAALEQERQAQLARDEALRQQQLLQQQRLAQNSDTITPSSGSGGGTGMM